ncbi:MAG: hypothetical protein JWM76_4353 [Pseudonocardiales bacterium]|nr:hypothetical protein [Pseudonocardiales bacterium]
MAAVENAHPLLTGLPESQAERTIPNAAIAIILVKRVIVAERIGDFTFNPVPTCHYRRTTDLSTNSALRT